MKLFPIVILLEFAKQKGFDFTDEEFQAYLNSVEYKSYYIAADNTCEYDGPCCPSCAYSKLPQFDFPCRICTLRNQ